MKVKPIGNRVLIKPKEKVEKTAGGIYLPDSAKEKKNEGTVVEVGDAKDMPVKKGDKVMYESYAGTEIKINDEKHVIMEIKDVIAKIE